MASIVSSRIIADTRGKGRAGLVVAEHVFDDGEVWPAVFEASADDDANKRLDAMIAEREATRVERDDAIAASTREEQARQKLDSYVQSLPDKTLTDAGFEADEIAIVKGDTVR